MSSLFERIKKSIGLKSNASGEARSTNQVLSSSSKSSARAQRPLTDSEKAERRQIMLEAAQQREQAWNAKVPVSKKSYIREHKV